MSMQQKTQGQQFLEILSIAKEDKTKMFKLLHSTLEKVNPFPSEKLNFHNIINQVTDLDSVAVMKAAKAGFNARNGAYMFVEDYIYLTAKSYKDQAMGGIEDFKRDFKKYEHSLENTVVIKKDHVKSA